MTEQEKATVFLKPRQRQEGGDHYKNKSIQPWDAMAEWLPPEQFVGFLRGNIVKYSARAGEKGDFLTDIKKAHHYAQKLIEFMEQRP